MVRKTGAHGKDVIRLTRIEEAAFPERTGSLTATDLVTPGTVVFADDEIELGFLVLRVAADQAEIITLGVVPSARRTGIATALLSAAEAEAADQGAVKVFLEVAADNAAARALYQKAGYRRIGCRPRYYLRRDQSRVDALVLSKAMPRHSGLSTASSM